MGKQDERDQMMTEGGVVWFNHKSWITPDSPHENTPDYCAGIALFNELDLATLKKLIEKGYADLKECQNWGKSIAEMMELMKLFPSLKGEGYVVTAERNDFRLTLTGLTYTGNAPKELRKAFRKMFKNKASEYEEDDDHLRSWYD